MKLEDISSGQSLAGVEPTQIVSVIATVPHGDNALQIVYRLPDGNIKERLLGPTDESSIAAATVERPFSPDGDGAVVCPQPGGQVPAGHRAGRRHGRNARPYYLRNPFEAEPGWGVSSINFDLKELLKRAEAA